MELNKVTTFLSGTFSWISNSSQLAAGAAHLSSRIRQLLSRNAGHGLTVQEQRVLLVIERQIDSLIHPLQYCVFWARHRHSAIHSTVHHVQEILLSVFIFIQPFLDGSLQQHAAGETQGASSGVSLTPRVGPCASFSHSAASPSSNLGASLSSGSSGARSQVYADLQYCSSELTVAYSLLNTALNFIHFVESPARSCPSCLERAAFGCSPATSLPGDARVSFLFEAARANPLAPPPCPSAPHAAETETQSSSHAQAAPQGRREGDHHGLSRDLRIEKTRCLPGAFEGAEYENPALCVQRRHPSGADADPACPSSASQTECSSLGRFSFGAAVVSSERWGGPRDSEIPLSSRDLFAGASSPFASGDWRAPPAACLPHSQLVGSVAGVPRPLAQTRFSPAALLRASRKLQEARLTNRRGDLCMSLGRLYFRVVTQTLLPSSLLQLTSPPCCPAEFPFLAPVLPRGGLGAGSDRFGQPAGESPPPRGVRPCGAGQSVDPAGLEWFYGRPQASTGGDADCFTGVSGVSSPFPHGQSPPRDLEAYSAHATAFAGPGARSRARAGHSPLRQWVTCSISDWSLLHPVALLRIVKNAHEAVRGGRVEGPVSRGWQGGTQHSGMEQATSMCVESLRPPEKIGGPGSSSTIGIASPWSKAGFGPGLAPSGAFGAFGANGPSCGARTEALLWGAHGGLDGATDGVSGPFGGSWSGVRLSETGGLRGPDGLPPPGTRFAGAGGAWNSMAGCEKAGGRAAEKKGRRLDRDDPLRGERFDYGFSVSMGMYQAEEDSSHDPDIVYVPDPEQIDETLLGMPPVRTPCASELQTASSYAPTRGAEGSYSHTREYACYGPGDDLCRFSACSGLTESAFCASGPGHQPLQAHQPSGRRDEGLDWNQSADPTAFGVCMRSAGEMHKRDDFYGGEGHPRGVGRPSPGHAGPGVGGDGDWEPLKAGVQRQESRNPGGGLSDVEELRTRQALWYPGETLPLSSERRLDRGPPRPPTHAEDPCTPAGGASVAQPPDAGTRARSPHAPPVSGVSSEACGARVASAGGGQQLDVESRASHCVSMHSDGLPSQPASGFMVPRSQPPCVKTAPASPGRAEGDGAFCWGLWVGDEAEAAARSQARGSRGSFAEATPLFTGRAGPCEPRAFSVAAAPPESGVERPQGKDSCGEAGGCTCCGGGAADDRGGPRSSLPLSFPPLALSRSMPAFIPPALAAAISCRRLSFPTTVCLGARLTSQSRLGLPAPLFSPASLSANAPVPSSVSAGGWSSFGGSPCLGDTRRQLQDLRPLVFSPDLPAMLWTWTFPAAHAVPLRTTGLLPQLRQRLAHLRHLQHILFQRSSWPPRRMHDRGAAAEGSSGPQDEGRRSHTDWSCPPRPQGASAPFPWHRGEDAKGEAAATSRAGGKGGGSIGAAGEAAAAQSEAESRELGARACDDTRRGGGGDSLGDLEASGIQREVEAEEEETKAAVPSHRQEAGPAERHTSRGDEEAVQPVPVEGTLAGPQLSPAPPRPVSSSQIDNANPVSEKHRKEYTLKSDVLTSPSRGAGDATTGAAPPSPAPCVKQEAPSLAKGRRGKKKKHRGQSEAAADTVSTSQKDSEEDVRGGLAPPSSPRPEREKTGAGALRPDAPRANEKDPKASGQQERHGDCDGPSAASLTAELGAGGAGVSAAQEQEIRGTGPSTAAMEGHGQRDSRVVSGVASVDARDASGSSSSPEQDARSSLAELRREKSGPDRSPRHPAHPENGPPSDRRRESLACGGGGDADGPSARTCGGLPRVSGGRLQPHPHHWGVGPNDEQMGVFRPRHMQQPNGLSPRREDGFPDGPGRDLPELDGDTLVQQRFIVHYAFLFDPGALDSDPESIAHAGTTNTRRHGRDGLGGMSSSEDQLTALEFLYFGRLCVIDGGFQAEDSAAGGVGVSGAPASELGASLLQSGHTEATDELLAELLKNVFLDAS
ncbi:hypothetical protein BESB_077160 [Besnoitia besnoiti]|uniref:Uncharacterized protein n=1 Tax=Besnoitia besnoiti TaxID=94643 RepID=A0A2A9M6B6_BESBE|nr:hypothetical protein BESB_077160 [Besnoitia besnoiti]PFH33499.1 hypothetical protein BESB_077160 [Besnoitia besnoiti]